MNARVRSRSSSWADRASAMRELEAVQHDLLEAQIAAASARIERDRAIRTAFELGWTYDEIIGRLKVTSATIAQAVRSTA